MILKSYAKINLSLIVNSKRKDNLHEIQSLFCLIDLADKIMINKIEGKKDKIIFNGPFSHLINKKNNSIINLLNLLRKLRLVSNFYSIVVTKNIPVFGGLGGGTSNAAFLMKFLLQRKKIKGNTIKKAENVVGSDLRFFFYKQGFLKNLGNIISLKKKHRLFFILIQPKIKCSTKDIYSRVKKYSSKKPWNEKKIISKKNFIKCLISNNNDLQSIVEKKYPIIKKLLTDLKKEKGCYFSRITGSGSVSYGLFDDKIAAKTGLIKLKKKYPKFWFSFAKTV